ncbi:MAG TPA: LytTR family DNA-binding domain-containing protein [Allosphingosinicella sp.]|jgi:DNA-binding LytR/AlgR family response regulator
MTPLRVLVCDDEPLALERLSEMLARCAGVEVVARTQDARDALSKIVALSPNLVMLDIEMPGLDGFDVVERLGGIAGTGPPLVAFVTAFPAFAIQAFETGALDFLAKPVRLSRLERTLQRARAALDQREAGRRLEEMKLALEALRSQRSSPHAEPDHVWIPRRGEFVRVDLDQIEWVRAEGEYVRLHTGNASHLYRELIGSFAEKLSPDRFLRIHRSYIVRRERVRSVRRSLHGGTLVRIASGEELPVGRKYAKAARAALLHHAGDKV